jgi:D-threo-aldose 1-dehydrogenase
MGVFSPLERRPLGSTGLEVSRLCIGSGGLGSVPWLFGYETPEDRAVDAIGAALASDLNFIDTSAGYSDGEAERRIGLALREAGGLPDGWVLETKVDPLPGEGSFDASTVRRSVEGSLKRLGLDSLQLLHLHDPERISFADAMAKGGPVEELIKIRDEGIAAHLGVAGGPVGNLMQFLETGVFEAVLTHNRYTLLDRTAEPLIAWAADHGVGVIQGAPFGGGPLANPDAPPASGIPGVAGTPDGPRLYAYSPMSPTTAQRFEALVTICREADVPLGAAAVQFALRDPRIGSVVVGVTRPERIAQNIAWAELDIPADVWDGIVHATGDDAGLDNAPR